MRLQFVFPSNGAFRGFLCIRMMTAVAGLVVPTATESKSGGFQQLDG